MEKYILHIGETDDLHAGPKAMKDCENILINKSFTRFDITLNDKDKIKKFFSLMKLFKIKKDSLMVVQHPLYIGTSYMKMLKLLKKCKNVKLVFIIHDLESLRQMFINNKELFIELDNLMFEIADYIISHNEKMNDYLINTRHVNKEKIITLGLFDYLVDGYEDKKVEDSKKKVVIAGNLAKEKSGYVYKVGEKNLSLDLELYGVNFNEQDMLSENFHYHGAFPPDSLPNKLEGSFGLVWDGDSLESCKGTVGKYVQYNNPHKVSLYVASKLPIIIWEKAALATLIKKENIGIAISDLSELEEKISDISDNQYKIMQKNLVLLSEKVRNGYYLSKAIKKVLESEE